MRLRRIDRANWKAVKAEGFTHVDGDVYDVPTGQAKQLLAEQPEKWEAASRESRKGTKPTKSAADAPPPSPMSTGSRPELAGGEDELSDFE